MRNAQEQEEASVPGDQETSAEMSVGAYHVQVLRMGGAFFSKEESEEAEFVSQNNFQVDVGHWCILALVQR